MNTSRRHPMGFERISRRRLLRSATAAAAHVPRAITVADHHHGYLPLLGSRGFRGRVRLLAQRDAVARLCVWCSL